MTTQPDWRRTLEESDPSTWPEILDAHSHLPGPRANLELLKAFASLACGVAGGDLVDNLASSPDEYRAACAAAALARSADSEDARSRCHALAADDRWRVRLGVEMGLQMLGDADPSTLHAIVRDWSCDPSPLVQRAAVAAICEPRLLRTPDAIATAIEICRVTTGNLAALAPGDRKLPQARTLRKALGYCWSVAVAADPVGGLEVFLALDTSDSDIAWIVRQNLTKKRLAALL